jgi:hypothetical protein
VVGSNAVKAGETAVDDRVVMLVADNAGDGAVRIERAIVVAIVRRGAVCRREVDERAVGVYCRRWQGGEYNENRETIQRSVVKGEVGYLSG